MNLPRRPVTVIAAAGVAGIALASCGGSDTVTAADGAGDEALSVVASFYPLQFVAEQVGGDHVQVENLTKPGAEPHDLELAPADVGRVNDADLVVYLSGFQPAVDEAVTGEAGDAAYDVADDADLDLTYAEEGDAQAGEDGDAHAGEDGDAYAEEPSAGSTDPHFWLDPTRLADVGDALAERLATDDETNASDYRANAAALREELEALDGEFETALATCERRELVTSHTAFGYLADRYDLQQEGLAGLSPEDEPSAADLAAVVEFVDEHQVTTIYYETLVSPAVADTVAQETGATTAVLDPLEGIGDSSAGSDYLEVMRSNLDALTEGLSCP